MGTITDKLTYLSETKDKIKAAINEKGVSVSDSDTFRSYPDKIKEIKTGSTSKLGTKDITSNGTYNASDDSLDGYSSVSVNVEGSGNLIEKTISSNGTYKATDEGANGYSSITVNVPTDPMPTFTVTFKNTDGTVLQTKTVNKGETAIYTGNAFTHPTDSGEQWYGWSPYPSNVIKDMTVTPLWRNQITDANEIQDSWAEIIANDNGSDTYYKWGSYKAVFFSENNIDLPTYVYFEKVFSGEQGTKSTWVARTSIGSNVMNSNNTNTGGWPASEMRKWLNDTVLQYFPKELREAIKAINKYSYSYNPRDLNLGSTDSLWLMSRRECDPNHSQEVDGAESQSQGYTITDNSNYTWLRTADSYGSVDFLIWDGSGIGYYNATTDNGVRPGFCL